MNTEINKEKSFFDLTSQINGYPKFFRQIKSKNGEYNRIKTRARFGRVDNPQHVDYDVKIANEQHVTICKKINLSLKEGKKVTWGIVVGDAEPRIFNKKDGTQGVEIMSRLLAIRWVAVDGNLVIDNRESEDVQHENVA